MANQTAEILKQLYLKKDEVNQRDILRVDKDSRKVNPDFKRKFGKVGS